jgi:nitronate monooxygenase
LDTNNKFLALIGTELPLVQAPMAGANGSELAIAVCKSGGLGSLPCAMLDPQRITEEIEAIRGSTSRPFNLNFLCHDEPEIRDSDIQAWRQILSPYYRELGLPEPQGNATPGRQPFSEEICEVVETMKPPVVSFHFGLPAQSLFDRVKNTGCVIMCSATTVEEAVWLEKRGVDVVIAQGAEAGGHRGSFLPGKVYSQPGTMALVPQVVDIVSVPVIAAGGIGDSRGIDAAFALGASAVQMGTAFLFCREASPAPLHLEALATATDSNTALTNLLTGLPARGVINRIMEEIGPINESAPPFPFTANDLAGLKVASEKRNRTDFTVLWAGQAASLAREYMGRSAEELINSLFSHPD